MAPCLRYACHATLLHVVARRTVATVLQVRVACGGGSMLQALKGLCAGCARGLRRHARMSWGLRGGAPSTSAAAESAATPAESAATWTRGIRRSARFATVGIVAHVHRQVADIVGQ